VHAVLERLCRLPSPDRTIEAARRLLGEVWTELREDEELEGLVLTPEEESSWISEAAKMIGNYFRLEDPASIRVHDVEARVSHDGDRMALRGIVDRIELQDDGGEAVGQGLGVKTLVPVGGFALGLVAAAIGATYWHLQDFTVIVLAAWLFWRDQPPAWQRWWLLVVVIGGEFAWGLTPLPILVGLAVWFVCLLAPARRGASSAAAASP